MFTLPKFFAEGNSKRTFIAGFYFIKIVYAVENKATIKHNFYFHAFDKNPFWYSVDSRFTYFLKRL
jgi:hypothetical protein